jgi:hypothetical protein
MDVIPGNLSSAAGSSGERLSRLAEQTARADTAPGTGAGSQAAMAAAAREAIFVDALLGAMRARLEELKGVSK